MSSDEIRGHSKHPQHVLRLKHSSKPFFCDRCRQEDFGLRFACANGCSYSLHKVCARPAAAILCTIYTPALNFDLSRDRPSRKEFCSACAGSIDGYCYSEKSGRFLHPACAALPDLLREFEYHGKTMRLGRAVEGKCFRCKESHPVSWSYVSRTFEPSGRRLQIHVKCAKAWRMGKWEKEHFGISNREAIAGAPLRPSLRSIGGPSTSGAGNRLEY